MHKLKYDDRSRGRISRYGFTIIEVVLVLAIAGLIFLMIFIGLPALQRSQRDAQRKRDIDDLFSATQRRKSNHGGRLHIRDRDELYDVFSNYWYDVPRAGRRDPDGDLYGWSVRYILTEPWAIDTLKYDGIALVYVAVAAKCGNDDNMIPLIGQINRVAIGIKLENGGTYCVDG